MEGKQVNELDALPSFTDTSLLPVHNGAGLKKGLLSQLASYLGTKFSNPNLLINPDFKINQRGATSYEQQGYSVDRWKIWNVTVTPNANGGITVKNDKYTDSGNILQYLENATEGDSTLSCYVTSVSGTVTMVADDNSQVVLKQGLNVVHTSASTKAFTIFLNRGTSITLKWVKLEQGTVATSFIAPDLIEEYRKCQRYFQYIPKLYCVPLIYTKSLINASDKYFQTTNGNLPTEMRTTKPTLAYKILGQSDNSTFTGSASFELNSKSIDTVTLDRAISNFTITINGITLDAEIY
jgi:hypothetical protein|nr:MAG TPA: tail fiber protein [Caudoviricetes sp.]